MRLYVTAVRGLLHKRTERFILSSGQTTTDQLLDSVCKRFMTNDSSFKLIHTVDAIELRIIRGWKLSHYGLEEGDTLQLEVSHSIYDNATNSTSSPLNKVEEDPDEEIEDASDLFKFKLTSVLSQSSKISRQTYQDRKLERLITETIQGNLHEFCSILREQAPDLQAQQQDPLSILNELGQSGWSVLHFASFHGRLDIVQFLLIKGVDCNLETLEGWTALMLAIKAMHIEIVKNLLLHPSIQINHKSKQYGTALCVAVQSDNIDMVKLLFQKGADYWIVCRDGIRASQLSMSKQMTKLLSQYEGVVQQQPYILMGTVNKLTAFFQNKLRFLVVDPFKNSFTRYENEWTFPKKPLEVIKLSEITNVRMLERQAKQAKKPKHKHYFEVFCPGRQIYSCGSKSGAEFWVESIFKMAAVSMSMDLYKLKEHHKKIIRVQLSGEVKRVDFKKSEGETKSQRSIFEDIRSKYSGSMMRSGMAASGFMARSEGPCSVPNRRLIVFNNENSENRSEAQSIRTESLRHEAMSQTVMSIEIIESLDVSKAEQPSNMQTRLRPAVHKAHSVSYKTPNFLKRVPVLQKSSLQTKKPSLKLRQFQIINQLGRGAFGKVFRVKHKQTEQVFALKALSKRTLILKRQIRYALSELNILKMTSNPFIVKLYYAFQTKNYLCMCLDFCGNGDLSQYLAYKEKLPEEQAKWIIAQLILAIEHLHSKNIIYRDLKPQNLLLHQDGFIRLADFGLSKAEVVTLTNSFCGSPAYLSPQMLAQRGVGKQADIYGIGCVLYEIIVGEPPHFSPNIEQLYKNIRQGRLNLPTTISEECRLLLRSLLHREPARRITIKQAKSHPFFKDVNFQALQNKLVGSFDYEREKLFKNESDSDSQKKDNSFTDEDYQLADVIDPKSKLSKFTYNYEDES